VEAVQIGPVSNPKFPDNREINREFFKFGSFSAIPAPNQRANSIACRTIPYAMEQGIFLAEQGILALEQGIHVRFWFDPNLSRKTTGIPLVCRFSTFLHQPMLNEVEDSLDGLARDGRLTPAPRSGLPRTHRVTGVVRCHTSCISSRRCAS
jgi:hypothetical protein